MFKICLKVKEHRKYVILLENDMIYFYYTVQRTTESEF